MPKLPIAKPPLASPRPPPAVCGAAGGYSEAWLEELDGLLRAYHEQLYARLDLRLEAAVAQLKEHGAVPKAVVRGRRAPLAPPGAPGDGDRSSGRVATVSGPRSELVASAEDLDQEDEKLKKAASTVAELHRLDSIAPSSAFGHDSAVRRFVNHPRFESFFAAMILTNAIYIAVKTDLAAVGIAAESNEVFFAIGVIYTMIFTVEIILRIAAQGRHFFLSRENWAWNSLDLFVVLVSLLEAGLDISVRVDSDAFGDSQGPTQFRILRIIRITKVIRLIRVTRIIRFIRALRTLVHQIMSTLRSLVWALLLLLLVIFLFAVTFTQAATAHRAQAGGGLDAMQIDLHAQPLTRYWSTLPRSMYTLFKAITGGVSWEEVSHPLSDIDQLYVIVFLAYICFAQMAVLNVLTGVFCQNAIDSAAHDQDLVTQSVLADKRMYVNQIQSIFKDIDEDSSGSITIEEFKKHLENERMRAYFDSLGLDTSDVWTLFKLLDTDKGSIIEFDEFVSGCLRLKGSAKGVDIAKLSYEHRWMAKRLGNFMKRTDEALASLLADSAPHHEGGGAVPHDA